MSLISPFLGGRFFLFMTGMRSDASLRISGGTCIHRQYRRFVILRLTGDVHVKVNDSRNEFRGAPMPASVPKPGSVCGLNGRRGVQSLAKPASPRVQLLEVLSRFLTRVLSPTTTHRSTGDFKYQGVKKKQAHPVATF